MSTLPRIRTPCRGFLPDLSYHDTNGELLGGGGSLTGGLRNSLMYEQPQHETLYYQWVPFFLLFQVRKCFPKSRTELLDKTDVRRIILQLININLQYNKYTMSQCLRRKNILKFF